MGRLLRIMAIAALTFVAFSPVAEATGITSGLEESGTACGATALLEDAAAGTLDPGEVDWYDASYDDGGARDLKLTSPPTGVGGWESRIFLYEWDKTTNTCTQIDFDGCAYGFSTNCGLSHDRARVTQPGPGDYQIAVDRQASKPNPTTYVVTIES